MYEKFPPHKRKARPNEDGLERTLSPTDVGEMGPTGIEPV